MRIHRFALAALLLGGGACASRPGCPPGTEPTHVGETDARAGFTNLDVGSSGAEGLLPLLQPVLEAAARAWSAESVVPGKAGDVPCEGRRLIALSGGGQNGAWGAGFLNGWWDRPESRPEFDVVTGVSTGALQASFVFVHTKPANDAMETAYRNAGVEDLIEMRPVLEVPFSSSLARARGLQQMMERCVSNSLIDQVEEEGRCGRRLFIGTIDLDSGLLNIWDMVEIAKRRQYDLYRKVLLASASEPPVFPPVCIDGAFHMDGGVREQVFVPRTLQLLAARHNQLALALESRKVAGLRKVEAYFLINGVLTPDSTCVQPRLLDVGLRSIDLLANEGRIGNLWKSWAILQGKYKDDVDFRLASIPVCDAIQGKSSIQMKRADVDKLYQRGYAAATRASLPWVTSPQCIPDFFVNQEVRQALR